MPHPKVLKENEIGHTAKDETVRVYTGNAFDISGERKQTKFDTNNTFPHGYSDESFEISVRNHKKEAATVRVVEHPYRWHNWTITTESDAHAQKDSRTVEYEIALQPDQSEVVSYTVHFAWVLGRSRRVSDGGLGGAGHFEGFRALGAC